MNVIDFRSDTVTQPTQKMREAMANSVVGDDVYGDDPTVNELEALAADKLGYEAAIYTATGTQANLLALLSHCERGDEYIVGQQAHNYRLEGGGAAVLGSIQPQPISEGENGSLSLEDIQAVIKPIDPHFARTKLLCLENTHSGRAQSLDYLKQATALAKSKGLASHLDGARLFNAVVKQGLNVKTITAHFDSTSICLSKGLAAPMGSLLCGDEAFIHKARRWRKVLGGGMRQAGVVAATGIIALNEQIDRLAEDHDNARHLADKLSGIQAFQIKQDYLQTNMVYAELNYAEPSKLTAYLKKHGVLVSAAKTTRFVTHKDVDINAINKTVDLIKRFFVEEK